MFRPLFPISTAILSAAIVLAVAPAIFPGPKASLPQEPAATPAPAAAPAEKNPVKPTAESQAKAKRTYGFDCALCHGANGNGKTDLARDMQLTLTDLSDPKTLAEVSDADLFVAIRNGKNKMPAEAADRAKDDVIWSLVTYVRNLAKNAPAATASNP